MSEIKVSVTGSTFVGKTAIATIIGRALHEAGIPVTVNCLDGDFPARNYKDRADSLVKKGLVVVLEDINVNHNPRSSVVK